MAFFQRRRPPGVDTTLHLRSGGVGVTNSTEKPSKKKPKTPSKDFPLFPPAAGAACESDHAPKPWSFPRTSFRPGG
jgi:hypothetical protein